MTKNRLEAFSDGVLAVIITIMVLEMKPPQGATLASLRPVTSIFLSYVLSFVFLAIYWNNHHHLLQASERVNGSTLWANLHLLFWLSLFPFTTNWMGESHLSAVPTACYGFVLFMTAVAWYILTRVLIAMHGENSPLERAVGADRKGKLSVLLYLLAIAVSFWQPWV